MLVAQLSSATGGLSLSILSDCCALALERVVRIVPVSLLDCLTGLRTFSALSEPIFTDCVFMSPGWPTGVPLQEESLTALCSDARVTRPVPPLVSVPPRLYPVKLGAGPFGVRGYSGRPPGPARLYEEIRPAWRL